MRKSLKYIQYLSLDVVLGAIISSLFIAKLLNVSLGNSTLIGLGIAIWLIYTTDHLLDAKSIKGVATNPRHAFHQKYFNIIASLSGIVFCLGIWNIFSLPLETIKFGGILIFCVGIYFFTIRMVDRPSLWHKELSAALIYCFGVFAGPLSLAEGISYSVILLFCQFLIIVTLNLLIFPIYEMETDKNDQMKSLAISVGLKTIHKIIKSLFILSLILALIGLIKVNPFHIGSDWLHGQYILLLMLGVLQSLVLWPHLFKQSNRYRIIGDSIFYLPALLFL